MTTYLTVREAAILLRRKPYTIRRRCAAGVYPGAQKDGGGWLIPREAVKPGSGRTAPEAALEREVRDLLAELS